MNTNRRFSLAEQALTELQPDLSTPPSQPTAGAPALSEVLASVGSIPSEALFLGVASDGLPVLLNLHDPHPGPMLIAADAGAGKTAFLRTVAHALARAHHADNLKFGVMTNYPDEWEDVRAFPHHAGVFAVGQKSAAEFLRSLANWAHTNKNSRQCMLLLVDDLESVASLDIQAVRDFRWLLLRGPARRIWPLVTLNAPRYGQILAWLQNFRTRVFGHIADRQTAEVLSGDKASGLSQLETGIEFTLREKENWLRFWLPRCDAERHGANGAH